MALEHLQHLYHPLPVHPILMAGGRGSRLSPLTEELPKPLLKVGDKTLLEHNLDRLIGFGVDFFHVAVHYLAHKVSDLLGDGADRQVVIRYIMEDLPLGTIGALGLVSEFRHEHVLVMNADLLTNMDFDAFYQEFLRTGADLAIATRSYSISLPFGVLEVEGSKVLDIREKPNFTYPINAGVYLLRRELAAMVPEHRPFDATDLIRAALNAGKRVVTFPLLDYWLDIGNPEDYERAQRDIQYLKL